jgi:hypothetical protein
MALAYEYVVQFPLEWKRNRQQEKEAQVVPKRLIREDFARLRASLGSLGSHALLSGSELLEVEERRERPHLATAVTPLDRLLGGGLPKGELVELTGRRSTGRFAIVISILAAVTSCGEAAALIDVGDHLDPEAAEEAGVDLDRMLWVRGARMKDAAAAAEMLLATGFPLVVIDCGVQIRGKRLPDAAWLRLSRAAESHGGSLLISAPYPITGFTAESSVSIRERKVIWKGRGRSPRLLGGIDGKLVLEKKRHQREGEKQEVRTRIAG